MKEEIFFHPEKIKELGEAQSPLWFWNDKLKKKELVRQMELMTSKGVTCITPHARSAGFIGGYMDEEWMEHIRTVVDYKRKHDETMWLYDEFNWPSGIANGEVTRHEKFREKYLYIQRSDLPANNRFRCQPEKLRKKKNSEESVSISDFTRRQHIDNIFVYDADTMEKLDVTAFQPEDCSGCRYNISGFDFEILRDKKTIVFQAKILTEQFDKEGFYDPDYLNHKATEKFIDRVYEKYYQEFSEDFGTVITVAFDDETRFCHALPWTDNLPDKFEEKYGYCIEEHIPELIMPGEKAGRVRCDYFNLIADMYRDNYHAILRKWCENHKIDYCPHLLGEETLAGQVRYSGDFMRQFREVSRVAVDHLGKGIGSLDIMFATSAAELYGKNASICEAFAACGWEFSFEEYIRMISWLFSQGIGTIMNHGFFYSVRDFRKDDWPPSQFFQWQGWEKMKQANAMCRRLYGIACETRRKTDILIYHPVETFWMHYIPDQNFTHGFYRGPLINSEKAAQLDRKEQILLNSLQEKNRDFTVFVSDATDMFRVKEGKLININTKQSYTAFILPMCEIIPLETAKLLCEFTSQGGKLLILESIPKYAMNKEEDAELKEFMKQITESANTTVQEENDVQATIQWLEKNCPQQFKIISGKKECKKNVQHYPEWIIDPYVHTGENITGISWTHFEGEADAYYLINYGEEAQLITVEIRSIGCPQIWDPFEGEIKEAEAVSIDRDKNIWHVKINLDKRYGIFLMAQ